MFGDRIFGKTQQPYIVCTIKIMLTMASEAIAGHPKRRLYSPELKDQVVAECSAQGASVAGVALAHGFNANIVHRCQPRMAYD